MSKIAVIKIVCSEWLRMQVRCSIAGVNWRAFSKGQLAKGNVLVDDCTWVRIPSPPPVY